MTGEWVKAYLLHRLESEATRLGVSVEIPSIIIREGDESLWVDQTEETYVGPFIVNPEALTGERPSGYTYPLPETGDE